MPTQKQTPGPVVGDVSVFLKSTISQQIHDASIVPEAEKTVDGVELSNIPWKLRYTDEVTSQMKADRSNGTPDHFPPWNYLDLRRTQNSQWATKQLTEGIDFAKAGNEGEAEAFYKKGLHLVPDHVDLLVAYGALCANQGRMDEAIEKLEKAITLDPQSPNAQSYLDAVRRRQVETSQRQKSPSVDIRTDRALHDAELENAILFGSSKKRTKAASISNHTYPLVNEDSDEKADADSSVDRRTRKHKKKERKYKKRSKRKRSRHDFDSGDESIEAEYKGREGKRRSKKRKKQT